MCDKDCGYPNVRAADRQEEIDALNDRFKRAKEAAKYRGCEQELRDLRKAVQSSRAVICRDISAAKKLLSSDNELYVSFYDQVTTGARRPEDTTIEVQRQCVDVVLFPNYQREIRFAALSLDGQGVKRFGECSLELKEDLIKYRATVFERNSIYFFLAGNVFQTWKVPPGYRCKWSRRDQLAAAKLHAQLTAGMRTFSGVLLRAGATAEEDDFIEVHIYGPLHRDNVARVIVMKPEKQADKIILLDWASKLVKIGVKIEIRE